MDMKRKNFTIVPNELLNESQLSIPARYLFIVLLRFAGQDSTCYPGQKKLSYILDLSIRQVRNLLKELVIAGLVLKTRSGFNRPNTYTVSKNYQKSRAPKNTYDRQSNSPHIGSAYPLHSGNGFPAINTYRKEKDKKMSEKGLELLRKDMERKGIHKIFSPLDK